MLSGILRTFGLLTVAQREFMDFAMANNIRYGDAVTGLDLEEGSVDVVYSSHMLEHLDRREAALFLLEVGRLLRPGGLVRIAVPDIQKLVGGYIESGDADSFIASTHMGSERPVGLAGRLKQVLVGARHHLWMYDGRSLVRLLESFGFVEAKVLPAGSTGIESPASLDLREREGESVYVEARKPGRQ